MTDPSPVLLTVSGQSWNNPLITDSLQVDSDGKLGYAFYDSTVGWPSYIYTGSSFTAGYTSIVTTTGSPAPQDVTTEQKALINYYLSDTLGSVGGLADVHFRDSFADVANIQFKNEAFSAGSAQIFISDANVTHSTALAATEAPAQVPLDTFNGTGSQTSFTLSSAPPTINDINVYIGGVLQAQSGYSLSGTTLAFTSAPASGTGNVVVNIKDYFAGDIVLDNDSSHIFTMQDSSELAVGKEGALTILHELSHALGLIHANEDPGDTSVANAGFSGDFATQKYTIMGYNTTFHASDLSSSVFATGLQLYDIAALQSIYGRNYSERSEDGTVYTGGTVSGVVQAFGASKSDAFIYTIWDGDGNHDRIDATGYSGDAEIDLRQGHFSSIGSNGSGGTVSFDTVDGGTGAHIDHGNVAIAYHSIIEDAVGTGQDDVLIGNDWGNTLTGAAGQDVIFGDGVLYDGDHGFTSVTTDNPLDPTGASDPNNSKPGSDDDVLIGGADNDILMAGTGSDQIACGGDAATDSNGNVTGSSDGGMDTYIINMNPGETAAATVGESANTAAVSNASGAEVNTTLYAIDEVVAGRYDAANEISLSSSADMSGGMTFTDLPASDVSTFESSLALSFNNINALAPVTALTTGGEVKIGSTTIADFFNFGIISGTSSGDDFVLTQFAGRTFNGEGGTDTADYHNLTSLAGGPLHISQSTGTFNLFADNGGSQTDSLISVEHVIGTNMNDTFDLVRSRGNTYDGGTGSNKADYSGYDGGNFGIVVNATPAGSSTPASIMASAGGTGDNLVNIHTIVGTTGSDTFYGTDGTDDVAGHHLTYIGGGSTGGIGDIYSFTMGLDTGLVELSSAYTLYHDFIEISDIETIGSFNDLVLSETSFSAGGITYVDLLFNGTTAGDGFDVRLNKDQVFAGDYTSVLATFPSDPTGFGYNTKQLVNYLSDHAAEGAQALQTDMAVLYSAGNDYYQFVGTGGSDTFNGSGTGHDHLQVSGSLHASSVSYMMSPTNSHDLVMQDGTSGSSITLKDFLDPTTTNHQIEQIDFADGTVHTLTYILQQLFTQTGTSGNDTLTGVDNGNAPTDWLYGLAGNDTLDGGIGADTLVGGLGNDTFIVDNAGDVVVENSGEGTDLVRSSVSYGLPANVENLTLTGSANINGTGNGDVNIITGNSGNNTLDGHAGADTLIGGTGNDVYVVDDAGDVVTENVGEGTDTIQSSITLSLSSFSNIENLTLTGTGNINATGDGSVNIITGNSGNNSIDGGTGADSMAGGAGNDTYFVDNASDAITENTSEGTDAVQSSVTYTLSANLENLTLTGTANTDGTGNSSANSITGNSGNNTLDGGAGADSLIGGAGNDTYVVDNASDTLSESPSAGTDTVITSVNWMLDTNFENLTLASTAGNINGTGNSVVNIITGNTGNNTLDGGAGADTLIGGGGNDTFVVDNAGDSVTAGSGTDTISSSITWDMSASGHNNSNVENLTLTGSSSINGTGNALDNVITSNTGTDTLAGGTGNDTYFINNSADVISESGSSGTDAVFSSVTYTLAANVENLTLSGSSSINGTGNSSANIITGNDGDNTLAGGLGSGSASDTLYGGAGSDTLTDTGTTNDTLDGGTGVDTMSGGSGNDLYIVDNVNDVITEAGGGGTDTVQSSVSYSLSANLEILTLTGTADINGTSSSSGQCTITGNSGNNTLIGDGGGQDTLIGGGGNDTYYIYNANFSTDLVTESSNSGTDTVYYGGSAYVLTANVENLIFTGTAGVFGQGNSLANAITGTIGNDTLDGGSGADTLTGGLGNDTYKVDNTGDVLVENPGEGTDTVESSVSWTLGADFENLTLSGGNSLNGVGNGQDNIFRTATGAWDTLTGGAGNDTYYVTHSSDVVIESSGEGTDTVVFSVGNGTTSYTLANNLENLTLGSDSFVGTGNGLDNIMTASGSTDTLIGGAGNDTYVVLNSTDAVTEASGEGTDLVQAQGSYTLSSTQEIENLTLLGTSNINGTGNTLSNVITGNSGNNTLDGGSGADTLIGGGGNDTFVVDSSSDSVTGGTGTDTVSSNVTWTAGAEIENLTLTGSSTINGTGNGLDNTLTGNSAVNTLTGGGGNDTYVISNSGAVIIEATSGGTDTVQSTVTYTLSSTQEIENLTLTGGSTINGTGNSLDNVLDGSQNSAVNSLSGGSGNDTYIVGSGDVVVEGASAGIDTVQSSLGYTLTSNVENLTLTGGFTVVATGNTLDNVITGNGAGSTLVGGTGNDTYYVGASDTVSESASAGTDIVFSGLSAYTLTSNVEKLTLTGTGNFSGTGNSLNNVITGNSGDNTFDGGSGTDTLIGGLGNDTYNVDSATDVITENSGEGTDLIQSSVTFSLAALTNIENLTLTGASTINATGNSAVNILTGNGAANSLDGGSAADTMIGGAGNDTYFVDNVGDVVSENGSEGTDIVQSSVTFTLSAEVEKLTLTGSGNIDGFGNSSVNVITGNSGNNSLDGGSGADSLIGGAGNDTYVVDNASEVLTEGSSAGTDTVLSSVTWTLATNFENLTLTGSSAINGTGNTANNVLIGNSGANTLSGSSGNDTLDGGDGLDTLTGGTGNDTFVFHPSTAFHNIDIVSDFSKTQGDALDVHDILISYTGTVTDFVRISDSGSNSTVEIDRDGTGSTYGWQQIATLNGITGLTDEAALVSSGNLIVT